MSRLLDAVEKRFKSSQYSALLKVQTTSIARVLRYSKNQFDLEIDGDFYPAVPCVGLPEGFIGGMPDFSQKEHYVWAVRSDTEGWVVLGLHRSDCETFKAARARIYAP